ncbi:putative Cro regulatory protein [Syntrophobacter sp. SbD1]|nr:putative Cro regulatory protein [Syntrophobacter sp. SbD1]
MKRLKELRLARNYSQAQLAEMLKTTQQTIARWETGKSEPNIAALRDLAFIFGTSVDDLLGKNPLSDKVTTADYFLLFKDKGGQDGYWGNLGALLPGQDKTRWYPITLGSANAISHSLANLEVTQWLCVKTLNNRMLALNPTKLRRIWFLDEACDPPDDDWEVDWDSIEGNPLELYRALYDYFNDPDFKANSSDAFVATVEDVIKEHDLDEEKVFKLTKHTFVYMADGKVASYWAEGNHLWDFIVSIENEDVPLMISLADAAGDFESYYPNNGIAMIDMALMEVMEAAKEDLTDIEQEGGDE